MVFQDGALFPHRTVLNNVNYGVDRGPDRDQRSRAQRCDSSASTTRPTACRARCRVASSSASHWRAHSPPSQRVVLLDEPFSSLDASLRVQLRDEVRRLLTDVGVTTILVTHDQEEAMSFGDRVAVMNGGLIGRSVRRQQIYTTPVSPWVAALRGRRRDSCRRRSKARRRTRRSARSPLARLRRGRGE